MSAYESNIHPLYCEFYNNYKTMVVTSNIKNVVLISYIIYAVKTFLNVSEILPTSFFDNFKPIL